MLNGTRNTLTTTGTLTALNNNGLTLAGTIDNTGTFTLNSGGNWTELLVSGNATLSGTGTYVMSDSGANTIFGASTGTELLTNQGTIPGSGYIGLNPNVGGFLTLADQGTINAVSTKGNALVIDPGSGGATNTGTMEASSGGTLVLEGNLNNTGGTIQALAGGTVVTATSTDFSNAGTVIVSTGGTFKVTGTGNYIQTGTGAKTTVDGTLSASGLINIQGGSVFGGGAIQGNVQLSGTITPGGSSTKTGMLAVGVHGTKTQRLPGLFLPQEFRISIRPRSPKRGLCHRSADLGFRTTFFLQMRKRQATL